MGIEEASTFGSQFVEMRRLDQSTRSVTGNVAQAHVVGKDQYDIGFGRLEGRNRCQTKSGYKEREGEKRFHGFANISA
jgi:hypothetical protein